MSPQSALPAAVANGTAHLPSVVLNSYNVELRDEIGYIGDRASKVAFRNIVENCRVALRKFGSDPFGANSSDSLSRKKLDHFLAQGNAVAGIIHDAIEEFSEE